MEGWQIVMIGGGWRGLKEGLRERQAFERFRGGRFFVQRKGKGRRSVNGWLICYFFLITGRVSFLK